MDYRNKQNTDAWDEGVFGTGNTSPPKSYRGIIALLLILVIFLSGIVSLLSFMNIQLFQQLNKQNQELAQKSPMSVSDHPLDPQSQDLMTQDVFPDLHIQGDISMNLNRSPQSVDNIPEKDALSWQQIHEKNNPSVVCVQTLMGETTYSGSGVVLSSQGYIITNSHLALEGAAITVTLSDGRSLEALVVGADDLTDLAVLYVNARDLPSAEFGDSDALRVGDSVAALGGQLSGSLHDGLISAIARDVPFLGQNLSLIQTTIPLPEGGSGGPLINCYGQVIGIHSQRLSAGEGQGYAIPSTTVKQIVDQLISQGYVSGRPTLGLTGEAITQFDQYYFHIPQGLYLTDVEVGSDAWNKGIAPGDILISLEGVSITTQTQLDTIVNACAIGDTLEALFYRNGKEEAITITVNEFVG